MNDMNIIRLDELKEHQLEINKLGKEEREEFQKHITKLSEEEADIANKLGKQLYDLVVISDQSDKDIEKAIELIYNGANLEYKEPKKGDFALLVCARKDKRSLAYTLLRAGADVNQKNDYLTTATMAAARHGSKQILEMLILLGADVNARCLDGDTAIMSAKMHNQQECFDMLVKNGAHLVHRNDENKSLLDVDGRVEFDFSSINTPMFNFKTLNATEEDCKNLINQAKQILKTKKNG